MSTAIKTVSYSRVVEMKTKWEHMKYIASMIASLSIHLQLKDLVLAVICDYKCKLDKLKRCRKLAVF